MFQVWDSDTSAYIVAIASAGTLLTAILAAWFAWRQVGEARRTREARTQPFVVDIQPGKAWANLLTLVIENTGTTLARDVKISFYPPLTTTVKDSKLIDGVLIREGIEALPPGRRIETLFDLSHDRLEQKLTMRYAVTVSFSDFRRKRMEQLPYVIDLAYFYELRLIGEKTLHDVGTSLDVIRQEMGTGAAPKGLASRYGLEIETGTSPRNAGNTP